MSDRAASLRSRLAAPHRLLRDRGRDATRLLHDPERLARTIVENAGEGIWVLGGDGRIEFANPKLCELLGAGRNAIVGRRPADFVVGEPEGNEREELLLRRADGSTVWTLVSTHAVGDGAVVLVSDIDELKATQRTLHGATRRLAAIVAAQREIAERELDLDAGLATLLERTRELTGADGVELGYVEGDEVVLTVATGISAKDVGARIPVTAGLTGLCARTGEVVVSSELRDDDRVHAPSRETVDLRSAVLVPVRAGSLDGVLVVLSLRPDAFDDEAVETTRLMAEFASATLRNAAELRAKQELLAALAASEERFRNAIESSPIGFALCTPDDRYLVVNEAFCRIVGRSRAELDLLTWRDLTHPDDLDAEADVAEGLLAGRLPHVELEKRYVRGDGETVWIRCSVSMVRGEDGEPLYGLAQIQDITGRRQLEQSLRERERLLRAVFDQSLTANILFDDDGRTVDANDAAGELVGLPKSELKGRLYSDFAPPGTELDASWAQLRDSGANSGEAEIVTADGRRRTVVFSGRADVQPGLHLGVVQDVTAQRQLEERLRHGQKMEAVGRLAGGIAHDFNNVLTAISGYSELLLGELPPESEAHRHSSQINQAAQRAATLTRQLLAFSRRQVLRPTVIDLNTAVESMRDMITRLIGEDVRLVTRLGPNAEPVLADDSQIEQVVVNLAVNARDAMPRGGVLTIETSTVNVDPEQARDAVATPGRYSTVMIADTGSGMDEEQLGRLFEPFYSTKGEAGTGLGLATVYGIVRQSGGFLTVQSAPDAGSTFRIFLPATGLVSRPKAEPERAPTTGSETILLVEDEEIVRSIVTEMLELGGYSVLAAADGDQAVRLSASHEGPIDLLVSDVVMPEMSGQEVARRIGETRPQLRTLFVSGYNESAIANHGVLAPGTFFLQKPFSAGELAAKVREVLDAAPVA